MKRLIAGACAFCIVAGLSIGTALSFTITIKVSPNVIVLRSQTHALTVHTDIPLSQVSRTSVMLNGQFSPTATFADDRGNLVAKFSMDDVKSILSPPSTTLTLTGKNMNGDGFEGSQTVQVKNQ